MIQFLAARTEAGAELPVKELTLLRLGNMMKRR